MIDFIRWWSTPEGDLVLTVVGMLNAFIWGRWAEAKLWRGKALSGTRMCSNGKLYHVYYDGRADS